MLKALQLDEIDAAIYDQPVLRYLVAREYDGQLRVLPRQIEREDYAFALPPASPLRENINRLLLEKTSTTACKNTLRQYLEL